MNVDQRMKQELSRLADRWQLRDVKAPRGVDLCSNDYLGLAGDRRMKRAVRVALDSAERVASTGSRLLSGHDQAWTALENEFAAWIGAEAALYFTSGYAANTGLLGALFEPGDVVFSDAANHGSLIDGMRLAKAERVVFPHLDLGALESALRRAVTAARLGTRFIVVESVFSMDGDVAPLGKLATLAGRYAAELIVDEAHATGVFGPAGRGCIAEAGLSGRVFATVHPCGKALAAAGAFVCGSETLRRFLINRARPFIFSTALPPYFAAQVAAGVRLAAAADAERAHLAELGEFLRDALAREGFDSAASRSQIIPVILGANDAAVEFAARLAARGYAVRPLRPPTVPEGAARLRISLTAKFSRAEIERLARDIVETRDDIASAHAPVGTRRAAAG